MDQRKLLKARIENLKHEVNDLHPFLEVIFNKMQIITDVSYTHGPNERGADFVLTTDAAEFGDTEFIGVIAKAGKITANIAAVGEQITECMEKRLTPDGAREIYFSEIWVTANGSISQRAKEKIFERYKTQKIRFIPITKLVDLAEKYAPDFGTNLNIKDSSFLAQQREKSENRQMQSSLLPSISQSLHVEPSIIEIDRNEYSRLRKKRTSVNIIDEMVNHKAMLIEAPMGGGKTHLLNNVVQYFADPEVYSSERMMPVYVSCLELFKREDISLTNVIDKINTENDLTEDKERIYLLLFDGLDEVSDEADDKLDQFLSLIDEIIGEDKEHKVKVVITARSIGNEKIRLKLDNHFNMYEIVPLTLNKIISFISEICSSLDLKSRLIEDLKDSVLFKMLPKTPIAAIILAKLLSEGTEEVPANLTELYSQYCELALGRWDIDKGLSSLKEYEASDSILANIASFILDNQLQHIAHSEARDQFRSYLDDRNLSLDADELFNKVMSRSDILIHSDELDVISFKHRSFTEYFYAKNLLRRENVEISHKIFHPYWASAYFFYVGQKKDCPDLLRQIIETDVTIGEGERLMKILNLGNFLLAGYKSPYGVIQEGVQTAFSDARQYYIDIRDGAVKSFFSQFPPVQLIAVFRALLQDGYSYPFFAKAITSATAQIGDKNELDENDIYELLLLDATREELGTSTAIQLLAKIGKKKTALPIPVQSMICAPGQMSSDQASVLRPLEKRMRKQMKNSPQYRGAVRDAYEKSIDGTIEYSIKGKRLEKTSKHAGSRKR